MRGEFFLRAVGEIDDALIAEADTAVTPVRRIPGWIRPAGIAAACAVLVSAVVLAPPLLWRTASDHAAPEAEQNAWGALADAIPENGNADADKDDGYTYSGSEAEMETETEFVTQPVKERMLWFCDEGVWWTEVWSYPNGLPSTQTWINEYMAIAAPDIRCTEISCIRTGEKNEVIGDLVVHTAGVTVWTVTLDGDPGEDVCRGLVNTVLNSRVSSALYQVEIRTPTRDYPAHSAYEYEE